MKKTVAIIGGGNMGQAFALGISKTGRAFFNVIITNPNTQKLRSLRKQNIEVLSDNKEAVRKADIVILAVKPQVLLDVLAGLQDSFKEDALVISLAVGISIQKLERALKGKRPIVRVMPNLCAKIGESMSVWAANKWITKAQQSDVRKILESVGKAEELRDEKLINRAAAISGSGPAYVFYLAELLTANAQRLGLSKDVAEKLAVQTIFGSGLVLKEGKSPIELRASVTSKGGTTEAAFNEFKKLGFEAIFSKGIRAAVKRAKELNK